MYQHFCEAIPDIHCEIRCHWANGNDRACSEWHVTGTMANGEKLDWLGWNYGSSMKSEMLCDVMPTINRKAI